MDEYKYWDLGEAKAVHPSQKSMAAILDAIIRLHGKIHCTHCMELDRKTHEYRYPRAACAVLFRISLPVGSETKFKEITGFELTEPPQIGIL